MTIIYFDLSVICRLAGNQSCPPHNKRTIDQRSKYCSKLCAAKAKEKIAWPTNLQELVDNSSKKTVAAILGVSDKAIAKRLKNHKS